MNEAQNTLYQRVLGERYDDLPPVLRDFHALPQDAKAQGVVSVRHGKGWCRSALAKTLRLPPQGEQIKVQLQVQPQKGSEIWVRHFDNLRVETVQWQRDGFLVEKAGPICFAFYVFVQNAELRFQFSHNEIGGFKLPIKILQVDATARAAENNGNSWHIQVTIRAPLLGLLAEYRGEISPC